MCEVFVMRFEQQEDSIDVIGWDGFNGDDDICLGSVYKHEDDYYWFEPSADRIPLSCRQLRDIAEFLSKLNKGST
jgi:hypothetical protein